MTAKIGIDEDPEVIEAAATAREAINVLRRSCETAIKAIDMGRYGRAGPGEFEGMHQVIAATAVLQERVRAKP